jgi:hypothetical protein
MSRQVVARQMTTEITNAVADDGPHDTDAEQIVAGERGIALFATGLVPRGLRTSARAT